MKEEESRSDKKQVSQTGVVFSFIVKLASLAVCILFFSYLSFLFNEVYIKESRIERYMLNTMGFLVSGALLGLLVAPHVQTEIEYAHKLILHFLRRYPAQVVAFGSVGLGVGMAFSILAVIPVYLFLPQYRLAGLIGCLAGVVIFGYLGAMIFSRLSGGSARGPAAAAPRDYASDAARPKVIDSSVIIDGRLFSMCQAGFLEGRLLIPTVVLNEIQRIADDSDQLRRQRGRSGLELIEKLREEKVPIEIVEIERPKDGFENSVDAMLVNLAKSVGGILVTNDYNLSKVAELRDVRVFNLNVLANTLRKTLLPGEIVDVSVVKYGKESGQGIAYLDDGTMIVIESGDKFIGEQVNVEISSIMQTVAGRLIFARVARS